MKRRKHKPRKGNKIILIETYVKSAKHDFETYNETVYYVDTKRRKIWEEYGIDVTPLMRQRGDVIPDGEEYFQSWACRQSSRSLAQLIGKYETDFGKLSHLFSEFEMQVTEIGEL